MNKVEKFLENRLQELADISYSKGIYTYSDFLNLNEQNILNTIKASLPPIDISLVGGNVYAERKIAVFAPKDIYYEQALPLLMIEISPVNAKFSEKLSHRDFLGAVLNLGIDRVKIGDIVVKENTAYMYVCDSMADYIADNLYKIKHTNVKCKICAPMELNITPDFESITGTISNIRLDAVISLAFKISRSSIVKYIEEGKVFVNGKLTTSNGHPIKENDIISVRGLGRVIYKEQISVTKKGRNLIKLLRYV